MWKTGWLKICNKPTNMPEGILHIYKIYVFTAEFQLLTPRLQRLTKWQLIHWWHAIKMQSVSDWLTNVTLRLCHLVFTIVEGNLLYQESNHELCVCHIMIQEIRNFNKILNNACPACISMLTGIKVQSWQISATHLSLFSSTRTIELLNFNKVNTL